MKFNNTLIVFLVGITACFCLTVTEVYADNFRIKNAAIDQANLSVDQISKTLPLYVQLFDSSSANLGKPGHQDIAEMLARSAPHILAADIVEALRNTGFQKVVLDKMPEHSSAKHLILRGSFTDLNPGNQAVRAWIGFGAGKSKVCVKGSVSDQTGKLLGQFSHCRKGLGWGKSDSQMENSALRVGDSIAKFLADWANGQYLR